MDINKTPIHLLQAAVSNPGDFDCMGIMSNDAGPPVYGFRNRATRKYIYIDDGYRLFMRGLGIFYHIGSCVPEVCITGCRLLATRKKL